MAKIEWQKDGEGDYTPSDVEPLMSVTTRSSPGVLPDTGSSGILPEHRGAGVSPALAEGRTTTTTFAYDALHRRVWRNEGSTMTRTFFIYEGWNVIAEYAAISNPKSEISDPPQQSARLVWGEDLSGTQQGAGGIGGLLSASLRTTPTTKNKEPSTKNAFYHYDSNGNIVLLTHTVPASAPDTAKKAFPGKGLIAAQYRYDAFGKTIKAEGPLAQLNRYQFSTKPVEVESGLVYYGYRYLDTTHGRWISRDPAEKLLMEPNVFAFVSNAVNSNFDYVGLYTQQEWTTMNNSNGFKWHNFMNGYYSPGTFTESPGTECGYTSAQLAAMLGSAIGARDSSGYPQTDGQYATFISGMLDQIADREGKCCLNGQIVDKVPGWVRDHYPSVEDCEKCNSSTVGRVLSNAADEVIEAAIAQRMALALQAGTTFAYWIGIGAGVSLNQLEFQPIQDAYQESIDKVCRYHDCPEGGVDL